jgi:hypothetical protein
MTDQRHAQLALRNLGAAALLGVGIDHLQQYFGASYSFIPTIGTLFALNFASALVIAIVLFAPMERLFRHRTGRLIHACFAAAGIAVAIGSLLALLVSEQTPLFGFMESGYRQAIVISIVLEVATTVLLGAFLAGLIRCRRKHRPAGSASDPSNGFSPARRLPGRPIHGEVQ